MNRIDVDAVYKNLLELEGLLLLIKERGDEVYEELLPHFKERLSTLCGSLDCLNAGTPMAVGKNSEFAAENAHVQEPEEMDDVDEGVGHIIEIENSAAVDDHLDGREFSRETTTSADIEEDGCSLADKEPATESDEEQIASNAEFEEIEDADEDDHEGMQSESPVAPEVFRVGDMLPHQNQHDLRRSFTLNDRFRFRRELFGNNDNEFADALNLVSAMNTLSEAEEYFYDDLGWDDSNDEVKEFMSILSRYFNSRR